MHISHRVVKNVIETLATETGTRHHKLAFVDCNTFGATIALGGGWCIGAIIAVEIAHYKLREPRFYSNSVDGGEQRL